MSDPRGQPVELIQLDIEEILQFFISITYTKSVLYLGAKLAEDQVPTKDLVKARIAIDTTKMLVEKIKPLIPEEESKKLDEVVSNLQFTYLKEAS